MADLLDSILGSMEKPPVLDAEKKKARGQLKLEGTHRVWTHAVLLFTLTLTILTTFQPKTNVTCHKVIGIIPFWVMLQTFVSTVTLTFDLWA